ncbi:MAG: accessory gene regulator B family protein [Clostridia bacterium]|nr:accessory gene regulator B family protein [Clostridia bacterium]
MRFIHTWSYSCANYLMQQLNETHEKRRVYYYGFQIVIGALVKGVLLVTASLILQTLIPTLVGVVIFAILRSSAGGYHMDTYGKCIFTSLGLFLILGALTQYTYKFWDISYVITLIMLSVLIGVLISLKWAPADTPNKPITKIEEIRKFRKLSIATVILWGIAAMVLIYFKYNMYAIAGCLGLLLELFTITPAGNSFFDKISGKVDHIKNNTDKAKAC